MAIQNQQTSHSDPPPPPAYRSFILRCWTSRPPARAGRPPARRFVLEEVGETPRRRGFDSLAELLDFLEAELAGTEGVPSSQ